MREILFRGKRVDTGEWVEGLLWKKKYNSNKIFISYFPDEDDYEDAVVVSPETVGQFTGYVDKHGNKIFEGDVVQTFLIEGEHLRKHGEPYKAHYCSCFPDYVRVSYIPCDYEWESATHEVIGNIHDNPELLGGDKE